MVFNRPEPPEECVDHETPVNVTPPPWGDSGPVLNPIDTEEAAQLMAEGPQQDSVRGLDAEGVHKLMSKRRCMLSISRCHNNSSVYTR